MMYQYFKDMADGIEAKILQDPDLPNPRKKYALETARLGSRLYSGNNTVAWCGLAVPFDLLSVMGITSCFVEFVGAVLAATGTADPFLEEAEQAGFVGDTCGYHRSVMGAARKKIMPEPDFLIATTCPCSGGIAIMENLADLFNKDLFVLNVPQEDSEQNVAYLADQIRDMVEFVTRHTAEPLDEDKLRQAVENTNRTRKIMEDVYQLAQNVPSPTDGRLLTNFGLVMPLFCGTEAAAEIAQAYKDEFTARVDNGIPGVPDEKLRLLWIQNRIQFNNPLVELLEKEYRANIVSDELNDIFWDPIDPQDPYPGMARRAIAIPLNGSIQRRIGHLQKLARAYSLDGAINPCNWGCRQGTGARGLISEGLKEIGVPVLNLEVDCVDKRNFAEGQLRTRVEAFVEMLESRPRPA
ncbi:MAG: 2-hydroxyacyl-CoA dehydratase family protein [Desulfobacterales bacterium]|nr:2-hydroxyacyl-CoA dehydratase family protein [Desulfobacterales bacterium]MDH4010157.1 2-hydroxyacyl-CoA dehydratase family protein [Desulfobacterales bacterium]